MGKAPTSPPAPGELSQIWVLLPSSDPRGTPLWLPRPSSTSPEQEPRHRVPLGQGMALSPHAPGTRQPLAGTHHTGSSLQGLLLPAVHKHHFTRLLWWSSLVINVLICISPLFSLFKGQMNPGPELNQEENAILTEVRSNHLVQGDSFGFLVLHKFLLTKLQWK